jgi:hypothetical protein
VNGRVLQRPPWFFDPAVQGDGIMDIPTHLVDLVQWLLAPAAFDFGRDVVLQSARLWETPIGAPAFERITGTPAWPPELAPAVRAGVLPVPCNGELAYRLAGVPVSLRSTWELTDVPTEDRYRVKLRGTRARILMEHAMGREAGRRLAVIPHPGLPDVAAALGAAMAGLQDAFPGARVQPGAEGWAVHIPPALERSHEELFGRVLDRFLTGLERGEWWPEEARNLLCKYALLAEASARANRPPHR